MAIVNNHFPWLSSSQKEVSLRTNEEKRIMEKFITKVSFFSRIFSSDIFSFVNSMIYNYRISIAELKNRIKIIKKKIETADPVRSDKAKDRKGCCNLFYRISHYFSKENVEHLKKQLCLAEEVLSQAEQIQSEQGFLGSLSRAGHLFKSLTLGTSASYYGLLGTDVDFGKKTNPPVNGFFNHLVKILFSNRFFFVLTGGYINVFVHEMGHALMAKVLGNKSIPHVSVFSCGGGVTEQCMDGRLSTWQRSLVSAAGPITDMFFSSCKLITAIALRSLFPWPFVWIIALQATLWMTGEFLYALNGSDFAYIESDMVHHGALLTMVSLYALGILSAAWLL